MINLNKLSEAVYIGTTEKECEIGTSKFWGAPHITEDFDWPVDADGYDMDFICQIRTDDIDPDKNVFKKNGILYFFGCLTAPLGFDDEPCISAGLQPDGYFAVRFSDADNSDLQFGEIVDEDGNEVVSYEADVYVVETGYRADLLDSVKASREVWLSAAKEQETAETAKTLQQRVSELETMTGDLAAAILG